MTSIYSLASATLNFADWKTKEIFGYHWPDSWNPAKVRCTVLRVVIPITLFRNNAYLVSGFLNKEEPFLYDHQSVGQNRTNLEQLHPRNIHVTTWKQDCFWRKIQNLIRFYMRFDKVKELYQVFHGREKGLLAAYAFAGYLMCEEKTSFSVSRKEHSCRKMNWTYRCLEERVSTFKVYFL